MTKTTIGPAARRALLHLLVLGGILLFGRAPWLDTSRTVLAQAYCPTPYPVAQGPNPPEPPQLCEVDAGPSGQGGSSGSGMVRTSPGGERPCPKPDCTGSPCYVRTGVYVNVFADLVLPTQGFSLVASRHYRSALGIDGPMGWGWTPSVTARLHYTTYLFAAPSTYRSIALVILPDGRREQYVEQANGTFAPPLGAKNTFTKNGDGTFDLLFYPSKAVMHFDTDGALLSIKDRWNNTLTFTLDASRRVSQISAANGRYLNVSWGANGRISSITDNTSRTVTYGYDANGRLTSVTDPENRTVNYSYVQGRFAPLLSQITDPWGRVTTTITYDTQDRTASYTENGETFTYTYNYLGVAGQTSKQDSSGNRWVYPTSSLWEITNKTAPTGSGLGAESYTYDSEGRVLERVDGAGVKTTYTYDALGQITSTTQDATGGLAVKHEYGYDATFGERVAAVTPKKPSDGTLDLNWQGWRYEYHPNGTAAPSALWRVKRVKDDGTTLETVATYTYNAQGQVLSQTAATGGVTDYAYDASGNLSTVTSPANNDASNRPVTTYAYDGAGRVTSVTDALGKTTTYTYDKLDRILTVTLPKPSAGSPLNFVTTYTYDNSNATYPTLRFTHATDPNGKVTKLGYDQYGRLVKSIDALGNVTSYGYTTDLLTSITDAHNNVTSYEYDQVKRLKKTTFPDGAYETYTYRTDGLLGTKTDRKGQTITYGYDALKRLTTRTYNTTPSTAITFTYQGQKLTQVQDDTTSPTETHTFSYDGSYRVSSNTQGSRGTLTYTYLGDDRVDTMTRQGGAATTYAYYADGSLKTIAWSRVAGFFTYTYTLNGQYNDVTLPNGQKRTYSYDDQGRLLQIANTLNATNLATYAYAYDVDHTTGLSTMLGQRTSLTATVPSQSFTNALTKYYYDGLYQLTKADYPAAAPFNGESHAWTYDAIGNRLTSAVNGTPTTYTYFKNGANPLNGQRLSNDGVNAYTWDANGNNLTRNGAPGNHTFGYDRNDRLNAISGAVTASYAYDYQGRRASKTTGGTTTSYVYDGLNLVSESGAAVSDFVFGPGIDEPLASYSGGNLHYLNADALGTITATNDPAGTVGHNVVLDAWGVTKQETGTRTNPFTYTAREIGEAGLLFYRARYYQPAVGRFTQEDPLVVGGTRSDLFSYASNQPSLLTDAAGMQAEPRLPGPTPDDGRGGLKPIPCHTPTPMPDSECTRRCFAEFARQVANCELLFSAATAGCGAAFVKCVSSPPWTPQKAAVCGVLYTACQGTAFVGRKVCMDNAKAAYERCMRGCMP